MNAKTFSLWPQDHTSLVATGVPKWVGQHACCLKIGKGFRIHFHNDTNNFNLRYSRQKLERNRKSNLRNGKGFAAAALRRIPLAMFRRCNQWFCRHENGCRGLALILYPNCGRLSRKANSSRHSVAICDRCRLRWARLNWVASR